MRVPYLWESLTISKNLRVGALSFSLLNTNISIEKISIVQTLKKYTVINMIEITEIIFRKDDEQTKNAVN